MKENETYAKQLKLVEDKRKSEEDGNMMRYSGEHTCQTPKAVTQTTYRQIVKVTQESVDVYLQDIITEGMNFSTKDEATTYVLGLADKIEQEMTNVDKAGLQGLDQDVLLKNKSYKKFEYDWLSGRTGGGFGASLCTTGSREENCATKTHSSTETKAQNCTRQCVPQIGKLTQNW